MEILELDDLRLADVRSDALLALAIQYVATKSIGSRNVVTLQMLAPAEPFRTATYLVPLETRDGRKVPVSVGLSARTVAFTDYEAMTAWLRMRALVQDDSTSASRITDVAVVQGGEELHELLSDSLLTYLGPLRWTTELPSGTFTPGRFTYYVGRHLRTHRYKLLARNEVIEEPRPWPTVALNPFGPGNVELDVDALAGRCPPHELHWRPYISDTLSSIDKTPYGPRTIFTHRLHPLPHWGHVALDPTRREPFRRRWEEWCRAARDSRDLLLRTAQLSETRQYIPIDTTRVVAPQAYTEVGHLLLAVRLASDEPIENHFLSDMKRHAFAGQLAQYSFWGMLYELASVRAYVAGLDVYIAQLPVVRSSVAKKLRWTSGFVHFLRPDLLSYLDGLACASKWLREVEGDEAWASRCDKLHATLEPLAQDWPTPPEYPKRASAFPQQ